MRFLVLGPLEVTEDDGGPVAISGAKERLILADLVSHARRVVSVDELLEEVWGEDPPRTAEKTLGSYVSRLRRALEPGPSASPTSDVIETRGGGYLLDVADDQIDAIRFEGLAEEGRRLLDAGRLQEAGVALERALGLWRGAAYQDYRYTGFGTSEGERLEELRRSALEARIDTKLAAGEAMGAIPDLEAMVRDEPLRERRWGQLMLALYRAGRQAESLQAFVRARTVLVEELGIEPGHDLQRMQAAILAHDPALERRWASAVEEPLSSTDVCPYKGLARFETSDADFYFGREKLVAEAVGRLASGRFLALVGASGSGKSSLVRAGLLHALGSGAIPGSDRWTYTLMRPGDHPVAALVSAHEPAIQKFPGSESPSRTVLIVDQFEETFTACTDEAERTAFLDSITEAALTPDGATTLVLAMRADYYGRCAEHDGLASLVATDQILVGPMKADELRRAIELPAERAGLTIEDRLADALVERTVNQPGGLPLLSTALLELWTRRQDRTLRFDDYLRTGGVEGAVARMAEGVFERLDGNERAAAKRILLRLVGPGEGDEVVARAAPLGELEFERDADESRVLEALTAARLVTVTEGTVEVAHESLLRDWPRLRGWLEDDAEGRRLHRHVTESARAWDEGGRDDGDLYRGARLTAAVDWADAHDPDLNTAEREYLASSRAASEGETLRARRTNRVLRGLLAGVAVLLVVALLVGNLALKQRDEARVAADVADSRQLAAHSLTEKDTIVSLLLAREAVALDDSAQARSALLAALQRDPAAIAEMHATGSPPGDLTEWIQLSPDGRFIAAGGARTTVDVFDAATYRLLRHVEVGTKTTAGDFSPDGGTLAVAGVDERIVAIDAQDWAVRGDESAGRAVDAVLFSPAGDTLFTAESNHDQGFLVPRDPGTLDPSGPPALSKSGPIMAMASSADGRRLVTTSLPPDGLRGQTALWNERELEVLGHQFPVGGNDVALSPDGRTAVIAAAQNSNRSSVDPLEGQLVFLDLRTGVQLTREGYAPGGGAAIGLTGLAFSADGQTVVTTGDDQRILIWDASSATIEQTFDDPSGLIGFTPVLSPDGATAFTIDVDGNIVVWDLTGDRRIGRSFTAGTGARGLPWFAINSDGRTLAIFETIRDHGSNQRGSIRLVDTTTMGTIAVIPFDRWGAPGMAFSPNNKTLAVTGYGGYVQLWNALTGKPVGPPFRAPGTQDLYLWVAAFSPDGSVLVSAGAADWPQGVALLWDASTGQVLEQIPKQKHVVSALNFTPDSSLLVATTGWDDGDQGGNIVVWNADESRVVKMIHADGTGINSADISNDGTTLVTGDSNRERLWDLSTGDPIGPALAGPTDTVDLSSDGRTLVAAGAKGQVIMWDVPSGAMVGRPFPGLGPEETIAASFTHDGNRLFIVSDSGEAWVWDVDPASWEARACQIAGRSLTEAEWQANLPDRPYEPTCGP